MAAMAEHFAGIRERLAVPEAKDPAPASTRRGRASRP